MFTHLVRFAFAAALVSLGAGGAYAQAYPVKPLRMVVPFAPGGGTDVIARYVAAGMTESMGRLGVDIELSTPEEFGRLIESEMQRWGKLVRTLKLKVQ